MLLNLKYWFKQKKQGVALQFCYIGDYMKVKLKDKKMDRSNGLLRPQMKALNRGETIEVDEIPNDAKSYLVEVGSTSKKKGDK